LTVTVDAEDLGASVEMGMGGTLDRMFQAFSRIFEPSTSIDFRSIDGVYHPQKVPPRGQEPSRARNGRKTTHRVYTATARPNHVLISRLGDSVDVRV
jgi:hypothetical protein